MSEENHYVYIISCNDDTLYTGYTKDNVTERVQQHNNEEAAKYTRGRTPVTLVHTESFETKSNAMSREYEIKQLTRSEKEQLLNST
jgi:putative endonuclease